MANNEESIVLVILSATSPEWQIQILNWKRKSDLGEQY